MSEEETADVRAIALIRLAEEFQRTYERWICAWARLKSYRMAKALLKELEMCCESRGWKISEDVQKEVGEEIASLDFHINGEAWGLCRYYTNLKRLEQEIAKVLGKRWEKWRDGVAELHIAWESDSACSE